MKCMCKVWRRSHFIFSYFPAKFESAKTPVSIRERVLVSTSSSRHWTQRALAYIVQGWWRYSSVEAQHTTFCPRCFAFFPATIHFDGENRSWFLRITSEHNKTCRFRHVDTLPSAGMCRGKRSTMHLSLETLTVADENSFSTNNSYCFFGCCFTVNMFNLKRCAFLHWLGLRVQQCLVKHFR